ncbi:uncharacterized protein [Anabrus simplex]
MIREHDYVLFTFYNGVRRVTLIEVKSTSDSTEGGLVLSDARAIKNNKRTAQHQLRDHLDILYNDLGLAKITLDCHIFWPFLSSRTRDPQDNIITRWKDDGNLHAFKDIFQSEDSFQEWFQNNILQSPSVFGDDTWKRIFQRFIILSCGVFVDEIHQGMLALLSQEQVDLLSRREFNERRPLIIHGAAGTGKTMLIIRKLQQLYEEGRLHEKARALFICYWPGIRSDVEQKLEALGIGQYVDTERFFISLPGFLDLHSQGYKHIFMDESEAICLAFDEKIITHTFQRIFYLYEQGNSTSFGEEPGALWFMVDINQASLFLPKYSPNLLKTPDIILTKVIRSTKSIYSIFDRFYQEPLIKVPPAALKLPVYQKLQELSIGHNIAGPPIYWVSSNYKATCIDTVVSVVVDLCSTKGIKPNDLCVLPYLANNYELNKVNSVIGNHFVEGGFMPQAVNIVESFILSRKANHFLIPWVLRVKGLEFKVVIMVIDDEDFDFQDAEDRRKVYIMASRCTCLLVLISPEAIRDMIDTKHEMKNYPFTLSL